MIVEPQADASTESESVARWPRSPAEADEVWSAAVQAYMAELSRSRRDWSVWRNQVAVVLLGLLKATCFLLVVRMLVLMANLPDMIGVVFGLMAIPPVMVFCPRLLFRNLFVDRANAAFNAEIERRREAAQRGIEWQ